jgi:arsenite methyltransferase
MRLASGTALLNHHFIKVGFLDGWKNVMLDRGTEMLLRLRRRLDEVSQQNGEFPLTIPMAYAEALAV